MSHRDAVVREAGDDAPGRWSRTLVLVEAALLTGVYVLGATSVLFAPQGSAVAVWWPAAGLSVVLLLLAPPRARVALVVAVVVVVGLANFTAGRTLEASVGFGLSNAAEAFVVAWWLTRGNNRPAVRSMDDLWRLLTATLLGNLVIGAGIGTTVVVFLDGSFLPAAPAVMASHAAAIVLITTLALDVGRRPQRLHAHEPLLQWTLLAATTAYVFSPGQVLSLTFLPLPLLIWASLRMGLRTVSAQLVVIGFATTAATAQGWGPFAQSADTGVTSAATTAALVQSYLIVTSLIALALAVAVEQRHEAMVRVSESEEMFRKSFSESLVGMFLLCRGPEGLWVKELNETAATILGGTVPDLEGRPWSPMLDCETSLEEVADLLVAGTLDGWREELWTGSGRRVGAAMSVLSTSADEPMFTAQLIDVTEAHVASTRLSTEKDFTAAVLDTTACLIIVLDSDGHLVGMNPAAERASEYAEAELIGELVWESIFPVSEEATMRTMISRSTRSAAPAPSEGDLVSRSGRKRRVVWTCAGLADEGAHASHLVMTGIDVTEERTARTLVNHLLESATTTTFIGVTLTGLVTAFNTGAQSLLGYTAEEVVNTARLDQFHDPVELSQRALEAETPPGFATIVDGADSFARTHDWTYVHKDGHRITVSITISAVRDAVGNHIGYLAVGRDVTEARNSQQLLLSNLEREREAVERLRELDRAKNDFVSTVSHELRTPITSIVGYTEMLQDGLAGEVSTEQDRLLDAVRRNGERLISLIEDLLTLSRIEAGTFTLERTTVDLRSVVHRSREALGPLLSGRHLEVDFDLPERAVPVLGDPDQLERVLLNLVGNAVKFTEDGGSVRCTLREVGGQARIEVRDTGIGIPDAEQAELFSRFFRSSTAQARAIQGTGLGLSIVQSIVHSHGGEIDVRSEHLVGTVVDVVLPLSSLHTTTSTPTLTPVDP